MATAKTVRVDRERLIKHLKAKQADEDATRGRVFAEALAAETRKAEKAVAAETRHLAQLKKAKSPADVPDEYWARKLAENGALAQHIRLLELSDEDTITIGPTHDLFRWI